jgi:hypothetical protein
MALGQMTSHLPYALHLTLGTTAHMQAQAIIHLNGPSASGAN